MDVLEQFHQIVRAATDAERVDPYGWDLIDHGSKLVEIARANPDKRPSFVTAFISMVATGEPGGPFVEFCMHALKWDEIRLAIQQEQADAISRNDWRTEPYYRHLLAAFEPDWDDAKDLYASYFGAGA